MRKLVVAVTVRRGLMSSRALGGTQVAENSQHQGRLRMVALAVLTAVVLAGCGSTTKAAAPSITPSVAKTNAASATGKAVSSAQVVSLLAGEGIATVAKVTSTTAVEPVKGKPVLTFTTDQVDAMTAAAADHAGLLGSVLDDAHPSPAGDPSYSYLLAAWVSKGTSNSAAQVRSLMGPQVWDQAPSIVFPALALPLFTADVVRAAGSRSRQTVPVGVMQPASLTGVVTSPCSLVSTFISDVLDTVAEDLMLASPSGSGVDVAVGSFFVDLWNTAVGLAHLAIKNLLQAVTAPVLKIIESVAAMAAVIAEVVTNITPWTVAVTASPASIERGSGGTFVAKVSSGLGLGNYPAAVSDCANALKITLPSLTASGTPASWVLGGPLIPSSPTTVTLDASGSSTIAYRTLEPPVNPSCSGGSTPPPPATGSGTITVTRPAINDLKTLVSNLLSTSIPVAGGVVASILQPLVDEVLGKVDSLSQLTGTGFVTVTTSTGSGTGSGNGNCTPAGGVCMVGRWTAVNVDITTEGHHGLDGGRGSHWTIYPNGHEIINWSGSGPFSLVGDPQFRYSGGSTETVLIPAAGLSAGRWSAHIDTADVIAIYSAGLAEITGKKSVAVPSSAGISDGGRWTCTPGMLTVRASAEGSTITVELRKAS
jgi:hypothetical protein